MKQRGIQCRHVFDSECSYSIGFDETFFRELLTDNLKQESKGFD